MTKLQNPFANELLALLESGQEVLAIRFPDRHVPPSYLVYELANGSGHRLEIDMTREEFVNSRRVLKAWWNIIHTVSIEDIYA